MTDEPHLPRFLVRHGATNWMVWDRQTKGPAKYQDNPAVGLAEKQAREMADELTRNNIANG
jgi:broad specificity phosphatase PhoE